MPDGYYPRFFVVLVLHQRWTRWVAFVCERTFFERSSNITNNRDFLKSDKMSTYVRQMPKLAVPATQNTAPVLEFRCLYTHDLRQKKKRWQDGLLRFHTFNKRVMVYDVPRNFIGDTHWREGEVVQDGDELQLEKGVMIQVGEAIGSMEQDLTALLERRKPARDGSTTYNPTPQTTYASTARTTGAPSTQLRPKSLNALLGTRRGAYGRAVLPCKSPYQEPHSDDRQYHDESPRAKKRKIEGQTGHRYSIPTETLNKIDRSKSSGRNTTPLSPGPPLRKQLNAELICIESDDEDMRPPTWQRKEMRASPSTNIRGSRLDPSSLAAANHVATSNIIKPELSSEFTVPEAADVSGFKCTLSATRTVPPNLTEHRLANPLRFSSTKPRKKLMYKDLLSRQSPFEPLPESGNTPTLLGHRPVAKTPRGRAQVEPSVDISKLHEVQQERVGAALGFRRELENSEHTEISQSFDNSSLNAVSICNTDLRNLEPFKISAKEEEFVSGVGVEMEEAVSPAVVVAESKAPLEIRGNGFTKSAAFSPSAVGINEDTEDSELSQMDQLLLRWQKVGNIGTKSCTSPTADGTELVTAECQTEACKQLTYISHSKKLQEKTPIATTSLHPQDTPCNPKVLEKQPLLRPPLPDRTKPVVPVFSALTKHPSVPSRQRSHLKKSVSETDKTLNTIRPPTKTPLQKSVSDMTGVHNPFHKGQNAKLPIDNKDLDLGPWSREAFDLFG